MNYRKAIATLSYNRNTNIMQFFADYAGEERRNQTIERRDEGNDRRISPRETSDRRVEDIKRRMTDVTKRPTWDEISDNDVVLEMRGTGNYTLFNKSLKNLGSFSPRQGMDQVWDQIEALRNMKKIPAGKVFLARVSPAQESQDIKDTPLGDVTTQYEQYIAYKKMSGK